MSRLPLPRLCLFALLCATAQCFAQSYTPAKIVFTGAPAYKSADLLTASGLTPGKPLDKPAIEAAMQRLADPGLFSDINYTVDSRALTFTLTPAPAKELLPAAYSNFVIFDDGALTPLVHARVPLFTGLVPINGSIRQSVTDALTALLAEKGIHGEVQSILGAGVRSIRFAIASPPVKTHELHVDGVSATAAADVNTIRQAYAATEFDDQTPASVRDRLTQSYQDLGFWDAHVQAVTRSAPVITPALISVDVTAVVNEGAQYHVAALHLPQTAAVPAADLEHSALLKQGGPAGRVLVLGTTSHIEREFKRRGYLDAVVTLAQGKDASAHTFAYTYTVVPGEVYHLKSFAAAGLSPVQQAEVNANWKMKPGDVYNEDCVAGFLLRGRTTMPSLIGYSGKTRLVANPNDHTVQLTLTFVQGGKLE